MVELHGDHVTAITPGPTFCQRTWPDLAPSPAASPGARRRDPRHGQQINQRAGQSHTEAEHFRISVELASRRPGCNEPHMTGLV